MQTQKLRSGREMPMVGLGLWKIDQDQVADVVVDAIDAGYRHFDSACDYGNEVEAGVGLQRAMAAGTVTREALWVTSKLWNTYHRPEHVRPA
ncbi:MAG: D-xylose reductase, partial [Kiritimatiellia bacterium]